MAVAPTRERRPVHVQNLALTTCPAAPLTPERAKVRRNSHPDQSTRLIRGVPAGEQESVRELDVLRRHAAIEPADRAKSLTPKDPDDAGDDSDPCADRL